MKKTQQNRSMAGGTRPRPPTPPWPGVIAAYRSFLPVNRGTPIVTLQEGNTLLLPAPRLARALGKGVQVFLKFEGGNPTGSFKDRGMTLAISKALEEGARAVICASTGNTAASMSAYAARAGMKAFLLIPDGYVALGKLAQSLFYGARVVSVCGNFDQALAVVRALGERYPLTIVNSINPYRIEGQKTAAFEVCDQLGRAPDVLAIPVGNAGNITAYWRGFCEYERARIIADHPRMWGFEAEGAAAIVKGHPIEHPETVATAIRIGNPASWRGAEEASRESGGFIRAVSDAEILEAYRMLAREEGIFCEPASAASVAGLLKNKAALPANACVVCVLTGHGLKDPTTATQNLAIAYQRIEPTAEKVGEILARELESEPGAPEGRDKGRRSKV